MVDLGRYGEGAIGEVGSGKAKGDKIMNEETITVPCAL